MFGHEIVPEACEFIIPRTTAGGIVVFDDYNGMCDLGARLAIDEYFAAHRGRLRSLAESSAFYRQPPVPGIEPESRIDRRGHASPGLLGVRRLARPTR